MILSWVSPSAPCEITLEVNPENVTLEQMQAFRSCGINRISLGVQSFDDSMLKNLSRTHGADKARAAVVTIFEAGFSNISIDLMYDLPDQTLEIWRKTVEQAALLPITHLSLYNLTLEPHTVFYKKRNSLKLPSSETSLAMLHEAVETFEGAGLARYEISAFARNQQLSIHNSGYWTGRPFLGFGPSAFSYWNGSRFRNVAHLHRYASAADPTDFKETLSPDEQMKEALAIGLRLLKGVAFKNLPSAVDLKVSALIEEGFLEKEGGRLRLTAKGLLFHDTVAEEIINC